MLSFSFPVHLYLHFWSLHGIHIHKDRWVLMPFIKTMLSSLHLTYDFNILMAQVIWWDPCCDTRCATRWVFLPLAQFYSTRRGLWSCSPTSWVSAFPHPPLPLHRSCFLWHDPHLQSTAYTSLCLCITPLHGAWIEMYLKVFEKYDWGKSMKDSKWSMLLSWKRLDISHTFISQDDE